MVLNLHADSVTSACFVVTYAKGQMCSQKSVDEPCSITYPRGDASTSSTCKDSICIKMSQFNLIRLFLFSPSDVSVQNIQEKGVVTLTCNTSCPAAEPDAAFRWYLDRKLLQGCESQDLTAVQLSEQVTCAVKSNEDLISEAICEYDLTCRTT